MDIEKLIEEFQKLYEKGEITPSDMLEAGLDVSTINRISEMHDRIEKLNEKEKATSTLKDFILYREDDYEMNWHHEVICDAIDDFLRPDNPKEILILEAGPRTGKSQIVSRNLPAYYLGKNPDKSVVFATYASDLAKKMNRDVQRIIDSPVYSAVFPNTNLNSSNVRSTAKGNYVRTTDMFEIVGHAGSYKSVGVGGPLTGFGYNVGIIDDIIKDFESAHSPVISEATWNWFNSVFFTRRAKKAKIIIMMTRWVESDLIGRILEKERKEKTGKVELLSFPMLFDDSLEKLNPLDIRTEKNEPLWPSRFPYEECISIKRMIGSKIWASMYQQSPVPEGGAIFNRDWFKYYRELPEFDYTLLSLDCAFKDTQSSDFVVFGIIGVKGKKKYLIDVVRDRMSFNTTLSTIYALLSKFKGLTELIIEAKANGDAIISALENNPQITIPIFAFSPTSSKVSRASSISPQVEAGQFYLPDTSYEGNHSKEWVSDFLTEVVGFPNMKNDDQVDMMTQALIRISNSTMGWLEGILEGDGIVTTENIEDRVQYLAERMGWGQITSSGLDF